MKRDNDIVRALGFVALYAAYVEESVDEVMERLDAVGEEMDELLRFLERQCSVPFLLDARCGESLETTVEQDFERAAKLRDRIKELKESPELVVTAPTAEEMNATQNGDWKSKAKGRRGRGSSARR